MSGSGKWLSVEGLLYFKNKIEQIFAKKSELPTSVSQLNNDTGYITKDALSPYAKTENIPTKVSQLTNDAGYRNATEVENAIIAKGYQTSTQVETAITAKGYQNSSQVQKAINTAMAEITGIDFKIVTSLPTSGVKGTIYLLSNGGGSKNSYDEYVYINSTWEKIGTTDIDLSNYYNTSNFTALTNSEIDTIFS